MLPQWSHRGNEVLIASESTAPAPCMRLFDIRWLVPGGRLDVGLQRSGGYSAEFGEDGAGGRCVCAALSMDDQMAVSGGTDNSVKLWDVPSGRCLMALDGHNERVRGVAFSSANHSVASVADDGCARVWHVRDRKSVV